jgi:hypothetical protein
MAANKFKPTGESVQSYMSSIEDDARRKDCVKISRMMARITSSKPAMWYGNIVGFGNYHYTYDSGREGDACLAGFSSRGRELCIYVAPEFPDRDRLLKKLGKHKMAKSCLYIKKLDDVDIDVLEKLVSSSVSSTRKRYPARA